MKTDTVVLISRFYSNFNVAGCTGKVEAVKGKNLLVNVGNNLWWIPAKFCVDRSTFRK